MRPVTRSVIRPVMSTTGASGGVAATSHTVASFPGGAGNDLSKSGTAAAIQGTVARTLMAWANVTTITTTNQCCLYAGTATNLRDIRLGMVEVSGLPELYVWFGSFPRYASVSSPLTSAAWHHIAISNAALSDSNDCKLYVNGVLQTNQTINATSEGQLNIGSGKVGCGEDWNGRNMEGFIQDFRIYTAELSAADILSAKNGSPISTNAFSWYKMSDAADLGKDYIATADLSETGVGVVGADVLDSVIPPVPDTIYTP